MSKNNSKKAAVIGTVAFVAVAGFVGFGLWKASQPAPEVFQGQIEAQEADIAPKVTARIAQILVKDGAACGVQLANGERLLTPLVLLGIGVKPATASFMRQPSASGVVFLSEGVTTS